MFTPRCLWDLTSVISWFCMKSGGWPAWFSLREMRRDSVLVGLNDTSQVAAHREILERSEFRQSAAVKGLSTIIKRLVSSAKRRMFEPISVTISLMYNKNNKGSKRLSSIVHILSPETDNCPSWISGRERMTVENISWSISTKECCRPRRGLNPRPPGLHSDGASNWATEAGWQFEISGYSG